MRQFEELRMEIRHLRDRILQALTWKQYTKYQNLTIGSENYLDIDFSKVSRSKKIMAVWCRYVAASKELRVVDRRLEMHLVDAA
jgi:hypothetical protein